MMHHSNVGFGSNRKRAPYSSASSSRRRIGKTTQLPLNPPPIQRDSVASCHKCGVAINVTNLSSKFKEALISIQKVQYHNEYNEVLSDDMNHTDESIESICDNIGMDIRGNDERFSSSTASENSRGSLRDPRKLMDPVSPSNLDGELKNSEVMISEEVWENQWLDRTLQWPRDENGLDRVLYSDFFGVNRSSSIQEVLQARCLNGQWEWISDWEIDYSIEGCNSEGWIYVSSIQEHTQLCTGRSRIVAPLGDSSAEIPDFEENQKIQKSNKSTSGQNKFRRRRLIRLRKYGSSNSSWYTEMVNAASFIVKVEYPLCHLCESGACGELERNLAQARNDLSCYTDFLVELEKDSESNRKVVGTTQTSMGINLENATLEELEQEERRLLDLVQESQDEWQIIRSLRRVFRVFATELQTLQEDCFAEVTSAQLKQRLAQDELYSTTAFFDHTLTTLKRLRRYNVYNDAFHIWHEGPFGTINGLKLGRLPSRPVEWHELNAALGQAAMLLATIADCAGIHFMNYRVLPRGSFSKMTCVDGREYPLYSDGSFLKRRGFNHAMIWFLECIDEAGKMALNEEPSLQLPYRIQRGKIGDLSVCVGDDEEWTRALKYMLTHLKWLLAWVAKHHP